MKTQATISALRAISALVLWRFLKPARFIVAIFLTAGYIMTLLLSLSFSAWWLLLLFILVPLTVVFVLLVLILRFVVKKLIPRQLSKGERDKINTFSDRVFEIAEQTGTPYPIILFLIGKDVIRGKESSYLRNLIGNSQTVLREFGEIQTIFA